LNLAIYSVLNLAHGAGGERWIAEVSLRLKRKGHRVTIITTKAGNINESKIKERLRAEGIRVFEFDIHTNLFKIPKVTSFNHIVKLLKANDLIYFNNAFALNELFIYIMKRFTNIAVISGYHGTFPETGRWMRKMYHRLFNRIVSKYFEAHHVLNERRARILKSWAYRNVICIPNGVNTLVYHPSQKESVFTVMFAGSMVHQKGIDRFAYVIETINARPDLLKSIQFRIYGTGNMSRIPITLQKRFDNVKYFGYGTEEQLRNAYASSHVFVSPSRFDEFPLSPLEAHASGTPVIGSRISGIKEIVTDGLTGFLVDSENTDEIVSRILQLKQLWGEKSDEYNKFSYNAREMSLRFEWDSIVDKLEEFFVMLSTVHKRAG
jgi:glycosyltransferase involved in cell wall biosynthesis